MDIKFIRGLCANDENIEVTQHMMHRFQQRNIKYREIKEVIANGEIIEDYPEAYPNPACLLLGMTAKERRLHVVVGVTQDKLWIITAYEPDKTLWSDDFRKRKD